MSVGVLLLDHLQRARERRQGRGQRQAAVTSAGPTDATCHAEGRAPLLLGHVTEDDVIHYS